MSVSTEVQRTLVKSPPELWTELSNPEALARHLGDFGEIRIVNAEPETKVEWEAEQASGVVQLKQSGWGTKVTLSVTRTPTVPTRAPDPEAEAGPKASGASEAVAEPETVAAEPEPIAAEPEPGSAPTLVAETKPVVEPVAAIEPVAIEPEPVATEPAPVAPIEPEPEPVAAEPEPEPVVVVEPEPIAAEPEPVVVVEPEPSAPEPEPGFFARLFRKRKSKQTANLAPEPGPSLTVRPDVEAEAGSTAGPGTEGVDLAVSEPETEVVAMAAPEPLYPAPPAQPQVSEPAEDLASELESLEAQMAVETTELLTGVLDRLGAAHHRPFSRG